jgi:hypothetical protein
MYCENIIDGPGYDNRLISLTPAEYLIAQWRPLTWKCCFISEVLLWLCLRRSSAYLPGGITSFCLLAKGFGSSCCQWESHCFKSLRSHCDLSEAGPA